MNEFNAAGTRVATRPMWLLTLMYVLLSPVYRVYWVWRTNDDLRRFGRQREAGGGAPPIHANPAASALWMVLALPGWFLLSVAALPWGNSFAPGQADGQQLGLTGHLVASSIGLALLIPALMTLVRTRSRVRIARRLAGLPRDTRWSGRPFVVSLIFELAAVPVWTFALQDGLNDLWSRYPLLLDEDLHGEFAPPNLRDAAIAARPALHEARLQRIAADLEQPRARPTVALGFFALCIAVFAWQVTRHGFFPSESDAVRVGAYASNLDGAWWRFWVANVLHGSVSHIVGNMSLWLIVAIMVERVVGHAHMVLLIVAGAAGTSTGMWISAPHEVTLGASGVVFAAFGLAVLLDPRARRPIGRFGWTFSVIGLCFSTFVPGIASGGHVGGLGAGLLVGLVTRLVWRPRAAVTPDLVGWPATDMVDRTAPLAPDRELPVEARLQHLLERHAAEHLTDDEFERLRSALLTRG